MKHTTYALASLLLALPHAAAAQAPQLRYHVVQLAEIPSPGGCVPTAINDNGDVVGYCAAGDVGSFAVVWRAGTVVDLGKWANGTFTHAWAINSLGQIVGDGDDGDFRSKALVRGATGWIAVDTSGGSYQQAYGITDDGVVFGNFSTVGSPGTETWDPVYWTYDVGHDRFDRHDLAKPAGTISGAFIYAVTRTGSAVGQLASDLIGNQAGLWNNDPLHSLVVLGRPDGFASSAAFGVSDDARAVGAAANTAGSHAMLWQNDAAHTPIDLGTLAGDPEAVASAVNSAGQVVGVSIRPASPLGRAERAFLYQDGAMKELSALIDPADSGWTINRAVGINNAGQIIAVGTQGGAQYAIVLEPTAVTCSAISIAAAAASATVGAPFLLALSASGGVAPYSYAVDAGALPGGVTLSSGGVLSGVPTTAGDFTLAVTVTDAGGCSGTATVTMHVARAAQTIVFAALPSRTFGDAPFTVAASGGASGNQVTFSAAGSCSVAGDVVAIAGAGSCTVTAAQAGDANYEAATPVSQAFSIAQAVPVITWPAPADITFGTPLSATQLNATASVAGGFIYSPPIGAVLPLGTVTLTALFTPTDATNYTTATARVSITVVSGAPPDTNRIVQPVDQINRVGDRVEFRIFVTGDLNRGVFAATNMPPGLAIDKRDGLIRGRIKRASAGEYQVRVTFTQRGVTDARTFKWTVDQ
jgi:probable HAF family extracellular repeat protein